MQRTPWQTALSWIIYIGRSKQQVITDHRRVRSHIRRRSTTKNRKRDSANFNSIQLNWTRQKANIANSRGNCSPKIWQLNTSNIYWKADISLYSTSTSHWPTYALFTSAKYTPRNIYLDLVYLFLYSIYLNETSLKEANAL